MISFATTPGAELGRVDDRRVSAPELERRDLHAHVLAGAHDRFDERIALVHLALDGADVRLDVEDAEQAHPSSVYAPAPLRVPGLPHD